MVSENTHRELPFQQVKEGLLDDPAVYGKTAFYCPRLQGWSADPCDCVRRVTVKVEGQVSGFARKGETVRAARTRLTFEAENLANLAGDPRLHLTVKRSK